MKNSEPKFRTIGTKLILQCSECGVDVREVKDHETIHIDRGHYCEQHDDGAIRLNMPIKQD